MHIGIVPVLDSYGGGVYTYSLNLLRALYDSPECAEDQVTIFSLKGRDDPATGVFNKDTWDVQPLYPPSLKWQSFNVVQRIIGKAFIRQIWVQLRGRLQKAPDPDRVQHQIGAERWFRSSGVELMIYPSPRPLAFETRIPYIMAIHDLQHRLQPEFPEVSANGEWERREYLFRNAARYATLLLADSAVGKEDILNFYGAYGITPDRIKVLPFLPAHFLTVEIPPEERARVRSKYALPERYLFYPAQFWPHKNHARIVQALGLLKQQYGEQIPVVFCGSHSAESVRRRTLNEVLALVRRLRLESGVHYLGHVPDEDMSGLYAEAAALVMPTFFGPTNIPFLEAWAFGCPVLTSDIRGIREQVGDAAVLVDPRSVEAIADGIHRLWNDDALRRSLTERGGQRLARYTPEDYRRRLIDALQEAKTRVQAGNLSPAM